MRTATVHELKKELQSVAPGRLLELCLRLAKFKKENKELLTYLLFESHNEEEYVTSVKLLIDEGFAEIGSTNLYLTKKSLRKILRSTHKYIRYTGSKQVEATLLIYFSAKLKNSGIPFQKSTILINLYQQQIKKIEVALQSLHEDLQYDYQKEVDALQLAEKEGSYIAKLFRKKS